MEKSDLLKYNAFGLLSITQNKLSASVTAVSGERSITRSCTEELENPLEDVEPNETGEVIFGAWLEAGKQPRITIHEVSTLKSEAIVTEIPEVRRVLLKAVEMVQRASGIE